jgi:virginiamycin B lyase
MSCRLRFRLGARRVLAALAPTIVLGVVVPHAAASRFERFPIGEMTAIGSLVRGPDGALWFIGESGVGRLGLDGKMRVFARDSRPEALAAGPDGNLWLTEGPLALRAGITRVTPDGRVTRFTGGIARDALLGPITAGPDGALWFADGTRIARITTAGQITESYELRTPSGERTAANALQFGPDGTVWFIDGTRVAHMTLTGDIRWLPEVAEFESDIGSITVGPGGNIWVAGLVDEAILRIDPVTETMTRIPSPFGSTHLVFDRDGTLWLAGFHVLTRIAQDGTVLERAHDPFGDSGDCYSKSPGEGLAVDAAGQIWAADLLGSGLVRITSTPNAAPGPLTAVLRNRGALREPQALATAADGTLWAATAGALVRVPPGGRPEIVRRMHGAPLQDLAAGRDEAVWFTKVRSSIGRLDPDGRLHMIELRLGRRNGLGGITTDRRGEPWFIERQRRRIGHLTRSGRVHHYGRGIPRRSRLLDIAPGPDGAMWFTDQEGRIGRITRRGQVRMFRSGPGRRRSPAAITPGPDGAMWFTDYSGRVSRISMRGRVQQFTAPESPAAITAGPDGALWFTTAQTDFFAGLGRITADGHVSHYHVRHTCETTPWSIAATPDGSIWFGELRGPVGLARFDPGAAP